MSEAIDGDEDGGVGAGVQLRTEQQLLQRLRPHSVAAAYVAVVDLMQMTAVHGCWGVAD